MITSSENPSVIGTRDPSRAGDDPAALRTRSPRR
jgi:hypothetical protein